MSHGGTVPSITPSYSGFVNGDTGAAVSGLTCSTTATSSKPAGSYPTGCSGGSAANYTISYVGGTLAIGKATLTITASSPTMSLRGHGAAITPSFSGFVNGDTGAAVSGLTCSTTATASSPPGTTDQLQRGQRDKLHHQLRWGHARHRQGAADDHREQPQHDLRRHGPDHHAQLQRPGGWRHRRRGERAHLLHQRHRQQPGRELPEQLHRGRCHYYSIRPTVQGTLTIGPAPLTITASSPSMTYGGTVPAITPSYSGLVNGDTAPATAPTCGTTATSGSPAGTYPTSCSGAADPNYSITYVAGTLTVNPAPLTITADNQSMTYGGA